MNIVKLLVAFVLFVVADSTMPDIVKQIISSNVTFKTDGELFDNILQDSDFSSKLVIHQNVTCSRFFRDDTTTDPLALYYVDSNGLLKTYSNTLIWRSGYFTYAKNLEIFAAVTRCYTQARASINHDVTTIPISRNISRAILVSSNLWGSACFHKLFEKVFSMGVAQSVIHKHNQDDLKIVMDYVDDSMMNFFSLVGIRPNQVVIIREGVTIWVDHLYLPMGIGCGQGHQGATYAFKEMLQKSNPSFYNNKKTDIVILDRTEGRVCNSCLHNTQELIIEIKKVFLFRNIIHFVAGNYKAPEVMQILSNASVFVAPHGAGLYLALRER